LPSLAFDSLRLVLPCTHVHSACFASTCLSCLQLRYLVFVDGNSNNRGCRPTPSMIPSAGSQQTMRYSSSFALSSLSLLIPCPTHSCLPSHDSRLVVALHRYLSYLLTQHMGMPPICICMPRDML
jgi:hypothetical protein